MHANYIMQRHCGLFMYCSWDPQPFYSEKILKIGPTILFTHLKIILLQYFSVSAIQILIVYIFTQGILLRRFCNFWLGGIKKQWQFCIRVHFTVSYLLSLYWTQILSTAKVKNNRGTTGPRRRKHKTMGP